MVGIGLAFLVAGALQVDPGAPQPEPVVNGTDAQTCEFPAAASILRWDGSHACTVVVVHPRVVLLAAHCLYTGELETVVFGEDASVPAAMVEVEGCEGHPGFMDAGGLNQFDLAYCTLAADAPGVPIVPPLMGCEADQLVAGATVTLPGYGMNDEAGASGHGIKRWTTNTVESVDVVNNDLYLLGTDGSSVCYGDSGGPAYLQLRDGTWRVVGITSEGHPDVDGQPQICGYGAIYDLVHLEMEWFEQETGYDLTPCFDVDGTWSPDETCGAFPTSLTTAGLDWAGACATEELSGWSATCGEPFVSDGTGSTGTGSDTGDDATTADASTGDETGAPPPPDPTTGDPEGSSTSTSGFDLDGSGSTGAMPPASDGDEGCGCRTRAPGGLAWTLILLVGCVRRRRGHRDASSRAMLARADASKRAAKNGLWKIVARASNDSRNARRPAENRASGTAAYSRRTPETYAS